MSKKDNSSNRGNDSNNNLKKGLSSAGDLASLDKPTETQKPSDSSNNNESSSGQSENENTNGKN